MQTCCEPRQHDGWRRVGTWWRARRGEARRPPPPGPRGRDGTTHNCNNSRSYPTFHQSDRILFPGFCPLAGAVAPRSPAIAVPPCEASKTSGQVAGAGAGAASFSSRPHTGKAPVHVLHVTPRRRLAATGRRAALVPPPAQWQWQWHR